MGDDWKSRGICQQLQSSDPEMWGRFFADTALERREARNLCALECPVRNECLRHALENKEIWGVWGGCDEAELRRALWVDSNGTPSSRCRYPHCPSCKARPSKLTVVSLCDRLKKRKRELVECSACGFTWQAPTSVAAVKAYWREQRKATRLRARVPRGRMAVRTASVGNVVELTISTRETVSDALAASATR